MGRLWPAAARFAARRLASGPARSLWLPLAMALVEAPAAAASFVGRPSSVPSGDTLAFNLGPSSTALVRLYGVTAPQPHQPLGPESQRQLSELVSGRELKVEVLPRGRDGKVPCRAYQQNVYINAEIVRLGLAWWNRTEARGDRLLESAEAEARNAGRGLWGDHLETPPKDPKQALSWCLSRAEQGNSEAQYLLGVWHHQGNGVKKDAAVAVKWLREAALRGHPNAQAYLGTLLRLGLDTPPDLAEAAKWFQQAAAKNQVHAQASLGAMLREGQGVPKDLVSAYAWSRLAVARGNLDAGKTLEALAREMLPDQKAAGEAKVRELSERLKGP